MFSLKLWRGTFYQPAFCCNTITWDKGDSEKCHSSPKTPKNWDTRCMHSPIAVTHLSSHRKNWECVYALINLKSSLRVFCVPSAYLCPHELVSKTCCSGLVLPYIVSSNSSITIFWRDVMKDNSSSLPQLGSSFSRMNSPQLKHKLTKGGTQNVWYLSAGLSHQL